MQTREFHPNRKGQNVHIVADIWRIPDNCAFCDWGLQVPATRGYGICLDRTFLSGCSRRVLWKSAQIGQAKRQSRHSHIWLQWQLYSYPTVNIILKEEKISASHGRKLQITHYHPKRKAEKKINCFVFEQKQNSCFLLLVAMWVCKHYNCTNKITL